MEIYNPTYNSETNKIVAYLENPKTFFGWENSKIEISVDDELRDLLSSNTKVWSNYLETIMDKIEIYNNCCGRCLDTEECDERPYRYSAKLKQVDTDIIGNNTSIVEVDSILYSTLQREHDFRNISSYRYLEKYGNTDVDDLDNNTKKVLENYSKQVDKGEMIVPMWMCVEDDLPEFNLNVLVYAHSKTPNMGNLRSIIIAKRIDSKDDFIERMLDENHFNCGKVTHWAHLPKPPEK